MMSDAPRILLASVGSFGDVFPFVAIGRLLKQRGFDVTVLTSGYFTDLVEQAGLKIAPVGTPDQYNHYISHPHLLHPWKSLFLTSELLGSILEPIYEYLCESWTDTRSLIAASPYCMAARLFQERIGARLITVNLAPIAMGSILSPPAPFLHFTPGHWPRLFQRCLGHSVHFVTDNIIGRPINRLRRRWGLKPVRRLMQWWHSPLGTLSLFPDWFAKPDTDWPQKHVCLGFPQHAPFEQPLDGELDAFLPQSRQANGPVLFYPGSNVRHIAAYANEAKGACHRLQRKGLLIAPAAAGLDALPTEQFLVRSRIPMQTVLPRVSLAVHHGGIGIIADCLRAGLPHLIRPMFGDQPDNAARTSALGVSEVIVPARFRSHGIANAIQRLSINETTQTHCKMFAAKCLEQSGLPAAADFLAAAHPEGNR